MHAVNGMGQMKKGWDLMWPLLRGPVWGRKERKKDKTAIILHARLP